MNVFLWIVQAIVAAMFAMTGVQKLTQPKEKLATLQGFPPNALRLLGIAEVLGAVGLILPAATGIAPALTPTAATGLAIIMAGAVAIHIRRREPAAGAATAVLFTLAVVVAWGRFGPYGS
jgi:uncharacterized membrane protein YphA (DoxX/SURF4 family)